MLWHDVRRELSDRLRDCDQHDLELWLDQLTEGNGGHHLAYSLLMDLRFGNVADDVFCRVLKAMNGVTSALPRDQFHVTLCRLDESEQAMMWESRVRRHPVQCARIIEAADFVNYYYRSRGYLPTRTGDC